jgi:carboxyl-terminal processing protease
MISDESPAAGEPQFDPPSGDALGSPPLDAISTPPSAPRSNGSDTTRNILLGIIGVLIAGMLVTLGFLGRVVTEPEATTIVSAPATESDDRSTATSEADFLILDEILKILESDFVDPDVVDAEYLHAAAIQGLFDALDDPHSTYIDPETYQLSRDNFSGAFQGIGATVEKPEGSDYILIVRPLPDTPAEAAGILPGDAILAVDGEDASGWTTDEGVLRIRGPQGTPVELLIRHSDGTEELITIVRDEIEIASVSTNPLFQLHATLTDAEGEAVTDIGYVNIQQFTQRSPDELARVIEEFEAAGVTGIIIDVRLNPGGLLIQTTQIADMFLDEGVIVTQVDRDGNEEVASARPGQITELPIVMLQDEFSASGSELLAAALQENGRATVIGTKSFGKGTVNHVRELSNGGAVYVSIARWLTPDRNQIEGRGVTPDIVVEFTLEDIEAERDVQVERAIEFLRDLVAQSSVATQ